MDARAFWLREPGIGEIRAVALPDPRPGEVVVRALRSAVSRGAESLVFGGRVPASQREVMRAPFQEGDFPGPVKYGYLSVGRVEHGPSSLVGRDVFCLHPHQTAYVVPAGAVVPVPDSVPVGVIGAVVSHSPVSPFSRVNSRTQFSGERSIRTFMARRLRPGSTLPARYIATAVR